MTSMIGDRSELGSHTLSGRRDQGVRTQVRSTIVPRRRGSSQTLAFWRADCFRLAYGSGLHAPYGGRQRTATTTRCAPLANQSPCLVRLRCADVRWIKPVYPGDTITFSRKLPASAQSSRPGYGLVVTRHDRYQPARRNRLFCTGRGIRGAPTKVELVIVLDAMTLGLISRG